MNNTQAYPIQDLKKILNFEVKDYEVELGQPDKVINTIHKIVERGCSLLNNQCRLYLKPKKLIFITMDHLIIIPFDKIIGYELIDLKDDTTPIRSATTTITTTNTGDIVKRAVIGGAIAGGVGAIIGGVTTKSESKQESNMFDFVLNQSKYELRINVDDILNPLISIPFDVNKNEATEVVSTLNVIIKRNEDTREINDSSLVYKSISIVDIGNSIGISSYEPYKKLEVPNQDSNSGLGCSILLLIGISLSLCAFTLL